MSYVEAPAFMDKMFRADERLYAYAKPPPREVLEPTGLDSPDPWIKIAAVLEQAKKGNHLPVRALMQMHNAELSPMVSRACLDLIADAGDRVALENLAQGMLSDTHDENRREFCRAAKLAGVLWLAPYMAEAWARTQDRGDRDIISGSISDVLEAGTGPLYAPGRDYTPDQYRELVGARVAELQTALQSDRKPVWNGELFSVRRLAQQMRHRLLNTPEDEAYQLSSDFLILRHKLEAATGIDCSSFWRKRQFRPLAAAAILEDFLESPEAEKYEDGARYFFGHKVPD